MRSWFLLLILVLGSHAAYGQKGFTFPDGVDKIEIPFQSVYNLIILPVDVNGVPMNFLLDTGANKSVVFNFQGLDSLNVRAGEILKVSGYGSREPFEAYYSENNVLDINGYRNNSANILITVEQEINLQQSLGVQVHGIVGSDFFENAVVDINYNNQRLVVYKSIGKFKEPLRRFQSLDLTLLNDKPYVKGLVSNNESMSPVNVLIDTGRSDALWLVKMNSEFKFPDNSFDDFLGIGLNGKIYGRRSKIDGLILSQYQLNRITVSIPGGESANIVSVIDDEQLVSIGSEVLARFRILFDYSNNKVYLKSNKNFSDGFYYNMAGIEVKAGDKELFTVVQEKDNSYVSSTYGRVRGQKRINTSKQVRYKILPRLYVDYVRPGSPADLAGLQVGSEILKINKIRKGNLTLDNTVEQFFKNPYKTLRITTQFENKKKEFKLKLIPLVE